MHVSEATMVTATTVEQVTLYRDGAQVVRSGRAQAGWVEVRDLPLSMLSDQVRIDSDKGVVRNRQEVCLTVDDTPHVDLDAAERAVRDADREVRHLEDQLRQLRNWQSTVDGAQVTAPKRQNVDDEAPSFASWQQFDDAVADEGDRLTTAILDVEDALRAARIRLQDASAGAVPPKGTPQVQRGLRFFIDGGEGDVVFHITYATNAARWVPSYRLDLDDDRAVLRVMGMCANASGEDWSGASVKMSTSHRQRDVALPELLSWRMGRAQARPRPAFRAPPTGLDALFQGYDTGRTHALRPEQERGPPPPPSSSSTPPPPKPSPAPEPMVGNMMPDIQAQAAPYDDMKAEASMLLDAEEALAELSDELGFGGGGFIEDEDDDFDDAMPAEMEVMAKAALSMPPPAPMRAAAPAGAPMMERKRSKKRGGASRSEMAADMPAFSPDDDADDLVASGILRWSHMRLAGPDDGGRGKLSAEASIDRLLALLPTQTADAQRAVRQAVQQAKQAEQRLLSASLPSGTTPPTARGPLCVFEVPTPVRQFHSDGRFHRFEAFTVDGAAKEELRVVPRESDDVFRFCLLDTGKTQTPTGPLAVYEKGVFVVESELRDDAGKATREVGLGVEPGVVVKHRVVHVKQEEKGLVSADSLVDHDVELEVASHLKRIQELVVFDRLPQPADGVKNVEVELTGSQPKAERVQHGPSDERLQHGLRWRLVLQPGDVRTVKHSYRITLPAKEELRGGNRREQ